MATPPISANQEVTDLSIDLFLHGVDFTFAMDFEVALIRLGLPYP